MVDFPSGLDLRIREENLPAPPSVHEEGDRLIYEWVYEDIEAFESEPFSSDTSSVPQRIVISGDLQWGDIAQWYWGLTQTRYEVGPELEEKLTEVLAGSTTLSDSLRAVHRWVAQDIRYASISLGLGGYQPRAASEVLATGVGDCKDKTTLFLAVARHLGVEGYPVVVRNGGRVRPDMPSISQFNHMIAAIKPADEWLYLDLTVPVSPYGEIFGAHQGRTGVLLRDDGTAEVFEFPRTDASKNRSSIVIHGSLSENGHFEGTYTEVVTGAIQYRIRAEFARDFTTQQRASVRRGIGRRVFDEADVDSLELFAGRDLAVVPRLWAHVQAEDVLGEIPGGWMLPLRLPRSGSAELIARLEETNDRRFPIDAEKVFGRREHYTEYRIQLPEGWIADLPDDVRAISDFGHYESTYAQEGRELELVIRRLLRGTHGILPPERSVDLVEWFRTMYDDDVEYVVLVPQVSRHP